MSEQGWRERITAAAKSSPAVRRLRERVAGVDLDRLRSNQLGHLRDELAELRARVTELEQEVQECRRLNKRVAEVTDLVSEVLLPATHRDEARTQKLLKQYLGSI